MPSIKLYEAELFARWNENIDAGIAEFWKEVAGHGVSRDSEMPITVVLKRRRFKRVDFAIPFYNKIQNMHENGFLTNKMTPNELEIVSAVINNMELHRYKVAKRYLKRETIPKSRVWGFKEAVLFLNNCSLMDKYFTTEEAKALIKKYDSLKWY